MLFFMVSDIEKANFMYKLVVGKRNWGRKYERLEHLKRFENLNRIVKELSKKEWLNVYNKPNYTAVSLNSKKKR